LEHKPLLIDSNKVKDMNKLSRATRKEVSE